MTLRALTAAGLTALLLAGLPACGDDEEDPTTQATTTPPSVPSVAAPGVEQLTTTDAGQDDLIACLADDGVEAEPVGYYIGVASGSDAEYHFTGPATEIHLDEGEEEPEGEGEHGHGVVLTAVTFEDEDTASAVADAWAAAAEAVREGATVILGEPGQDLEGAPEVDAARECLAAAA